MNPGFRRSFLAVLLLPAGTLLMAGGPAAAQTPTGATIGAPVVPLPETKNTRQALPPALPGARSTGDTPTQAERPASEMQPTEALFDAINRGDIVNVRDAIARGADLGQPNVLGLSPIDLSVDLGRNEITFLLLSLRAAAPAKAPEPRNAAAKPARAPATKAVAIASHPVARTPQTRLAVAAEAPRPQQFVDRGPGTPVPQAGFLGFSGGTGR